MAKKKTAAKKKAAGAGAARATAFNDGFYVRCRPAFPGGEAGVFLGVVRRRDDEGKPTEVPEFFIPAGIVEEVAAELAAAAPVTVPAR